jgi:hypothetical protein
VNDARLPLSETVVAQQAEWGSHLPPVRLAACADHAAAERTPVKSDDGEYVWDARPGRDKSWGRQVLETVFACLLLVGAGALICWMGHA